MELKMVAVDAVKLHSMTLFQENYSRTFVVV